MDNRGVFAPAANAVRANAQALAGYHRVLRPGLVETAALAEMVRGDGKELSAGEVERLEERFGGMFKGTAFGRALGERKAEEEDPVSRQAMSCYRTAIAVAGVGGRRKNEKKDTQQRAKLLTMQHPHLPPTYPPLPPHPPRRTR